MKLESFTYRLIFFLLPAFVANADAEGSCYSSVSAACPKTEGKTALNPATCTAQFGQFPRLIESTEKLIKDHLKASQQFLMIANHFGEWNVNRKGFYEYFHKLSDLAWEDAAALTQHFVKRGGHLTSKFQMPAPDDANERTPSFYEITELHALSKGLDIYKTLASNTLKLITKMNHGPSVNDTEDINAWKTRDYHRDGEFAHFLADEVSNKHVLRIKHLANHVHSLSQALDETPDAGLVIYLYDTQFLK